MAKVVKKRKRNTAPPAKNILENERWAEIQSIAFWGLAILMLLPPFFRGFFFQSEQQWGLIFAVILFWLTWLWKWANGNYRFLAGPQDYFVLAFPVIYFISAWQAANYGLAIDEVIKTTLYFLVYWLASRLLRADGEVRVILLFMYIGAICMALTGLFAATGIFNIRDAFLDGRIYSSFQYPNALAAYLAALIFVGFYFWHRAGVREQKAHVPYRNLYPYLYAAGNFLLLTVLLGTKSNGGLLVFAGAFLLFLIGLVKGARIPVFIHIVLCGIPAVLSIWGFLSAVADGRMGLAWLWVFMGLALTVAGQALYALAVSKGVLPWLAVRRKAVLAGLAIIMVSGSIGLGVFVSGHGDLVKDLAAQIRLRNATERMYFYHDAMKMFKERPLLGWGGGGWQEGYRAYQGYFYNSNQVHGHYFQVMVETGMPGLLIILGIWANFLFSTHRLYYGAKENSAKRLLTWTITIAAVCIGLHAAIDFDLSLSAIAMVLWALFGMVRSMEIYGTAEVEERAQERSPILGRSILVLVSVASLMLIIYTGRLALAGSYASQAGYYFQGENINQEEIEQGVFLLQKACAYSPLNAEYHSSLANVFAQMGKFEEGLAEARKAVSIGKYSATYHSDLATFYLTANNNEEAVNAAEKALALAPFQNQWYEMLSRAYFVAGVNQLLAGREDLSRQYFDNLLQIPASIEKKMDGLTDVERSLWMDGPYMTTTPTILINVGIAQYFLGDWPGAEINLREAAAYDSIKDEALLWLSILKDKQGLTAEAAELAEQAKALNPRYQEQYQELSRLPLLN